MKRDHVVLAGSAALQSRSAFDLPRPVSGSGEPLTAKTPSDDVIQATVKPICFPRPLANRRMRSSCVTRGQAKPMALPINRRSTGSRWSRSPRLYARAAALWSNGTASIPGLPTNRSTQAATDRSSSMNPLSTRTAISHTLTTLKKRRPPPSHAASIVRRDVVPRRSAPLSSHKAMCVSSNRSVTDECPAHSPRLSADQ